MDIMMTTQEEKFRGGRVPELCRVRRVKGVFKAHHRLCWSTFKSQMTQEQPIENG